MIDPIITGKKTIDVHMPVLLGDFTEILRNVEISLLKFYVNDILPADIKPKYYRMINNKA